MTAAEIQTAIDTLKAQLGTGVARAKYDGREVEYRGTKDILDAIRQLERDLAAAQGVLRPRVTYASLGRSQ